MTMLKWTSSATHSVYTMSSMRRQVTQARFPSKIDGTTASAVSGCCTIFLVKWWITLKHTASCDTIRFIVRSQFGESWNPFYSCCMAHLMNSWIYRKDTSPRWSGSAGAYSAAVTWVCGGVIRYTVTPLSIAFDFCPSRSWQFQINIMPQWSIL